MARKTKAERIREWTVKLKAARDAMTAATATPVTYTDREPFIAAWREAREVQRATRAVLKTPEVSWMSADERAERDTMLASMEALCDKMIAKIGQTDVPYKIQES